MYEITIRREFCAAHGIRLSDGSIEPLHGHNWTVAVTIGTQELDEIDVVMDFHVLETHLDELLATANNRNLNEVLTVNPTAERVALWVGDHVNKALPSHARLISVQIGEAPGCTATWRP
jgi:6-pyruvoyltetrahydropterin/6-carboxytetrahydropterin synthase